MQLKPALPFLFLCSIVGTAQAALVDRGGGLIYDTDLDITWLQDANYAQTSGFSGTGLMSWSQATNWAANLSYFDSVRNVTWNDWRLPSIQDTGVLGCDFSYNGGDCGYNVNTATSEMAHLFHNELGDVADYTTSGGSNPFAFGMQQGPFTNMQYGYYWSSMEDPQDATTAWVFRFYTGNQGMYAKNYYYGLSAWAVRDGDVAAASTVPLPAAGWLLLSGLVGLGMQFRRRH